MQTIPKSVVEPSNGPLLVNNSLMKFGSRSLSILWKSAVSRYIEKRARYAWQICKWKSDRRFLANVIAARAIFYTRDDKIVEFNDQNLDKQLKSRPKTYGKWGPKSEVGNPKNWDRWYHSVIPNPPERTALPGEWDSKCEDKLKRMIVLRCFREDRVNYAIRDYVEQFMKKDFVESTPLILGKIME